MLSLLLLMLLQHHIERTELLLIILVLPISRFSCGPVTQDGAVVLLAVRCDWLLFLSRVDIVIRRQFEETLGRDLACRVLV